MVSHKVFKRVLGEYFRYILTAEGSCGNECCFDLPFNSVWFNLIDLDDYFDESDIPHLYHKYFTKIDPDIKRNVLERFPHLEPYFKENLWFQRKEPSTITLTRNVSKSTSNASKSSFKSGKSNHEYTNPSTSGYKSSDSQNSPIGSRANSPTPTQENRPIKNLSLLRNNSVNSTENEVIVIQEPNRYNFRQRPRKNICKNIGQPKRKYNKRLKLYSYLNELPDNLPPLKPHESNLILQSIDGRQITDLNIPLPICKSIFKQCRTVNPITKRYTAYVDDGSEHVPLNIHLKY